MTRSTQPLRALLILVLAAVLTACGGGGSDTTPEEGFEGSTVIGVGPNCEPVHVQLFGDSTMDGYVGATGKIGARNPGTVLQELLDARFGMGRVLVTNHGVGGSTLVELAGGHNGFNDKPWPSMFTGHIAVVNHGINDTTHGTPLDAYGYLLEHMHDVRPLGTTLIFQTPHRVKVHNVEPYAVRMRDVAVAKGAPLSNVYTFTKTLANWFSYLPDWAHPTEDGYELVTTKILFPVVAAQVAQRTCK
jgi:lysophospholipase L1-like esterase